MHAQRYYSNVIQARFFSALRQLFASIFCACGHFFLESDCQIFLQRTLKFLEWKPRFSGNPALVETLKTYSFSSNWSIKKSHVACNVIKSLIPVYKTEMSHVSEADLEGWQHLRRRVKVI